MCNKFFKNAKNVSVYTYMYVLMKNLENNFSCPGGVAQWTSHPTQRQQTWFRIPPGNKVFRKYIEKQLCVFDLICIICVLKKVKYRQWPKLFKNIQSYFGIANEEKKVSGFWLSKAIKP
jgi:hypothetical protein